MRYLWHAPTRSSQGHIRRFRFCETALSKNLLQLYSQTKLLANLSWDAPLQHWKLITAIFMVLATLALFSSVIPYLSTPIRRLAPDASIGCTPHAACPPSGFFPSTCAILHLPRDTPEVVCFRWGIVEIRNTMVQETWNFRQIWTAKRVIPYVCFGGGSCPSSYSLGGHDYMELQARYQLRSPTWTRSCSTLLLRLVLTLIE